MFTSLENKIEWIIQGVAYQFWKFSSRSIRLVYSDGMADLFYNINKYISTINIRCRVQESIHFKNFLTLILIPDYAR